MNFLVIYGFGLPWLYVWLTVVRVAAVSILEFLTLGLLPFVAGDVVKLVPAAAVGRAVAPSSSFDRGPAAAP